MRSIADGDGGVKESAEYGYPEHIPLILFRTIEPMLWPVIELAVFLFDALRREELLLLRPQWPFGAGLVPDDEVCDSAAYQELMMRGILNVCTFEDDDTQAIIQLNPIYFGMEREIGEPRKPGSCDMCGSHTPVASAKYCYRCAEHMAGVRSRDMQHEREEMEERLTCLDKLWKERARARTPLERRRARAQLRTKKHRPVVFERDGHKCRICGTEERLVVDHIIPISRGGSDELDNLQTLCWSCNCRKGAR